MNVTNSFLVDDHISGRMNQHVKHGHRQEAIVMTTMIAIQLDSDGIKLLQM
jgi:hypothetical protein